MAEVSSVLSRLAMQAALSIADELLIYRSSSVTKAIKLDGP